jgi:hypothetical protein
MLDITSWVPRNGIFCLSILVVGSYVVIQSVFVFRIAGDAFVIGDTKVVFNGSSEDRLVCIYRHQEFYEAVDLCV